MSRRRRLLFSSLSVLFSLLVIELASFALLRLHARPKGLLYEPEKLVRRFEEARYQRYLASRDPRLGWPAPSWAGNRRRDRHEDASGARYSPAFPEPGHACVSLYGDSFTWSDEVGDADAWGNVLAGRLGCRVANYGYGGYGTDQSYLRFREDVDDEAPVVILGHATGNITRNVNRWIPFRYMPARLDQWPDFKPRFVLDAAGRLELVPLPDFRFEELKALARAPGERLPEDFFVPGAPAGPVEMTFPYSLSVARAYRAFFRRNGLRLPGSKEPWMETYYRPGHASHALEVTEEIMVEFAETARSRGKQPLVFLLPTGLEVTTFQKTGEWISRRLGDAVSQRTGVPVVHIGERLATILPAERLCDVFTRPHCKGHYNARGYAYVAGIADQTLKNLRAR